MKSDDDMLAVGEAKAVASRGGTDRRSASIAVGAAPPTRRICVLILGMHRSGTSAITRVINLLGAELPKNIMPGVAHNNELGFWEPKRLIELNDRMLHDAGSRWDDWRQFSLSYLPEEKLSFYKAEIQNIITEEYGKADFFVLKEPRISRLVPIYDEVIRNMAIDIKYIHINRNPLAVSHSLHARDKFTPRFSFLLWLRHEIDAEFATRGKPRVFVSFEQLMDDWRLSLDKIRSTLSLKWKRQVDDASRDIESFLSREHQHYHANSTALIGNPDAPELLKNTHASIETLTNIGPDSAALEVLDKIRAQFNRISRRSKRVRDAKSPMTLDDTKQTKRFDVKKNTSLKKIHSSSEFERNDQNISNIDNIKSAKGRNLTVVFVNYGLFASNSGHHVAHFAEALAEFGFRVAIMGCGSTRDIDYATSKGVRTFFPHENSAVIDFVKKAESPNDVIVHAWTPRHVVVRIVEELLPKMSCPYVVHLEDNEDIITSSMLGIDVEDLRNISKSLIDIPESLSHPINFRRFIDRSVGATVIVDRLAEFVPRGPTHLLEPGVNTNLFAPAKPGHREKILSELNLSPKAKICVYHGNMHPANSREIFSLYTAFLILGRRGHNIKLVRMGMDHASQLDQSMDHISSDVLHLGYVPRQRMIDILGCADFFVQPGQVDDFNAFRLPSKIPEFLAMGRPVVMPRTNIGLRMTDGENAIMPDICDGEGIANSVERFLDNDELSIRLSRGARKFAMDEFNWHANARKLADFYTMILHNFHRARQDQ